MPMTPNQTLSLVADAIREEADTLALGATITGGPLHDVSAYNVLTFCARKVESFITANGEATRPEEREPKKVVAWLHRHHTTAYVITDTIKQLWLKAKPEHVENYTVPLYFGESLAAPVSPLRLNVEDGK